MANQVGYETHTFTDGIWDYAGNGAFSYGEERELFITLRAAGIPVRFYWKDDYNDPELLDWANCEEKGDPACQPA